MKVMDVDMESEDCANSTSEQPKKKKLKQARLPFQTLASSATPNMLFTKKRKNMSPSPTTYRSPKIVKITTKENSGETKFFADDEAKNDEEDAEEDAATAASSAASSEKLTANGDEAAANDVKIETKSQTKPGAITRFLQKVAPPDKTKYQPVVLLNRCDNSDEDEAKNSKQASSTTRKSDAGEKSVTSKSDDSSNEELAKHLEDSDEERSNDEGSKEKLEGSSDNPVVNSDSESERGMSSSDEEIEGRKTNDSEGGDETSNGKGLDKTPTSGVKSDGANAARRRLTPKQLEKKMESTKRREEREKLRQEREKKLEEDRLNRRKEIEARRREKKEKEEAEKELKRKEKEQKELKKQQDIEQKQKEKERRDKAKEEDRRKREEAKEEEKRKKEEERLEAKRKKQKAATTFVSFFVPKKPESKAAEEEKSLEMSNFMPFEVKADMRVAPICRRSLDDSEKSKFDDVCLDKLEGRENLYITEIKNDRGKIRKSGKTWPPESKDDNVILIEDDDVGGCDMIDQSNAVVEKQRAKLLAFAENRRPPYWGTWRKRSTAVTPRRPFSKDIKWFDYEVDSDEEWEEEEPGESIRGSDDEKDEENPDDDEYDVDNEFMVPHGYLSDEEAQADEDEEDMSPETQKLKLKILGAEFEAERKTQTSKIKPKVIGCIWQGPVNSYPENIPQKLVDFLMARQAWVRETPIMLATRAEADSASAAENPGSSGAVEEKRGAKKTRVPDEALPELIRLIHGNPHGRGFLIKEFMTFWNRKNSGNDRPLSKSSVSKKICEFATRMACPEEGPMHLRACWYVSEETRKAHLGDEQLPLPNCWMYALTPKRKTLTEAPEGIEKSNKEDKEKEKEKEKKIEPLITQYTKKITQEEMKKQLTLKLVRTPSPRASSSSQSKPHKRATLISVGRGEQFPNSKILNAFSKMSGASTLKPAASSITKTQVLFPRTSDEAIVINLESDDSVEAVDNDTVNSTTK